MTFNSLDPLKFNRHTNDKKYSWEKKGKKIKIAQSRLRDSPTGAATAAAAVGSSAPSLGEGGGVLALGGSCWEDPSVSADSCRCGPSEEEEEEEDGERRRRLQREKNAK